MRDPCHPPRINLPLTKAGLLKTICIDCRYINDRPSGIAESVQGLIDFIPILAPDLAFLLLRHPSIPHRLSCQPNVRELVVPHAANGPATMWLLPQVADLSEIDLFHAPANIMPARLPMPCVTTVHDVMWITAPELCASRPSALIDRAFYRHGIRRALRRASAIATVSSASRDAIVALAPHRAGSVHVTLSGLSPDFQPQRGAASGLTTLGLQPGRPFVLTVGQHAPYKNHEGAIRAFGRAFADGTEIDLVVVQRMSRGSRNLRKLVRDLGLTRRVHFLATVSRDELIQLYSSATALLHPSYCEGFGNPVAEAMACGCPVVTSGVSAMPEVAAGAAMLVDPYDIRSIASALCDVVCNPEKAERMRRAGLERASQLTWRKFAADTLDIYREVLKSS
jgi:glycosyltransferase involved in cell wall biosynthesis